MTLTSELREHLDVNPGDIVKVLPATGKHGKFLAIWKADRK